MLEALQHASDSEMSQDSKEVAHTSGYRCSSYKRIVEPARELRPLSASAIES